MIAMATQKHLAAKDAYWLALSRLQQLLSLRRQTQRIPQYIMRRPYSTREILIAVAQVRALRSSLKAAA